MVAQLPAEMTIPSPSAEPSDQPSAGRIRESGKAGSGNCCNASDSIAFQAPPQYRWFNSSRLKGNCRFCRSRCPGADIGGIALRQLRAWALGSGLLAEAATAPPIFSRIPATRNVPRSSTDPRNASAKQVVDSAEHSERSTTATLGPVPCD